MADITTMLSKFLAGLYAGNVAIPASTVSFSGSVGIGTSSPTAGYAATLPAMSEGVTTPGIAVGAENLIRTFRPTGSDGYNLWLGKAGNSTLATDGVNSYTASHNIGIGWEVHLNLTTGYGNINVGRRSGWSVTTGYGNVGVGFDSLNGNLTGYDNAAIGRDALNIAAGPYNNAIVGVQTLGLSTGSPYQNAIVGNYAGQRLEGEDNAVLGFQTLAANTKKRNTAIGAQALYVNDGQQNVALGWKAGYWETGSGKLFIDNAARDDEADGRAKALVYGFFDAAVANQFFQINGKLISGMAQSDTAGASAIFEPASQYSRLRENTSEALCWDLFNGSTYTESLKLVPGAAPYVHVPVPLRVAVGSYADNAAAVAASLAVGTVYFNTTVSALSVVQ